MDKMCDERIWEDTMRFKKIEHLCGYSIGQHIYLFSCSPLFPGKTNIFDIHFSETELGMVELTNIMRVQKPIPRKKLTEGVLFGYLTYIDLSRDLLEIYKTRYPIFNLPGWIIHIMREFGIEV